jgi:hypothetical protein
VNELGESYKRAHGVAKVPNVELSDAEKMAMTKVANNNADLDSYFAKRTTSLAGSLLHPTMGPEVLNFVDGKRSYYEIYIAVKAESLAAGAWYYGIVTLEDVVALLDANVQRGALMLR